MEPALAVMGSLPRRDGPSLNYLIFFYFIPSLGIMKWEEVLGHLTHTYKNGVVCKISSLAIVTYSAYSPEV